MWQRRDVYGAGLGSQQGVGVWAASAFPGWCSCHSLSFPQFYFSSPPLLTAPSLSLPFISLALCHCLTNLFFPRDPEHLEMPWSFSSLPL